MYQTHSKTSKSNHLLPSKLTILMGLQLSIRPGMCDLSMLLSAPLNGFTNFHLFSISLSGSDYIHGLKSFHLKSLKKLNCILETLKYLNNKPVSMEWFCLRVLVEKKRICLSAVPPPEANNEGLLGHQPIAFTAALWSWNLTN